MALNVLAAKIKIAATKAFHDNRRLADMPHQEREIAAAFFAQIALQVSGSQSELARLYNIERARFLRGEISRIAPDAVEFGLEIGYISKQ